VLFIIGRGPPFLPESLWVFAKSPIRWPPRSPASCRKSARSGGPSDMRARRWRAGRAARHAWENRRVWR